MVLTDRQLLILQAIIDDFIRSAQPIGSGKLSKREEINLSSATIRNEMADLEEYGYIEKPILHRGVYRLRRGTGITLIIYWRRKCSVPTRDS